MCQGERRCNCPDKGAVRPNGSAVARIAANEVRWLVRKNREFVRAIVNDLALPCRNITCKLKNIRAKVAARGRTLRIASTKKLRQVATIDEPSMPAVP